MAWESVEIWLRAIPVPCTIIYVRIVFRLARSEISAHSILMTTTNKSTTVMTREQAIAALVERDVAKWGEAERAASEQMRSALSHGMALNALAHYEPANIDRELAKQAKALLSKADKKIFRAAGSR